MIWGRPVNLWLGLAAAISGAVAATLIFLGFDPVAVGTLAGVWQGVLGAIILLVANQPPTVNAGSDITVTTPAGQPNATATLGVTRAGEVTVSQPSTGDLG